MAASIATALGANSAFTDTATGQTRAFPIERVPGKGLLPRYTFPSTGHWGDIGFALLRTYQDRAVLELRQHDLIGESIQNKAFRDAVVKDRAGLTVTIPFDSARPEADAVP